MSKIESMNNIVVKKNESLLLPIIWVGKEDKIDYNIELAGINSSLILLMLLLGKKQDKLKIQIKVVHKNKHTKSKVIVKGILSDRSNLDFNGLVQIEKNSLNSSAWLGANLLLLSDNAKGQVIPALEIMENDVKAGHETTIGKIRDEELFYLMSRGFSEKKAKKIITQGFLREFLELFPEEPREKARKELKYEL